MILSESEALWMAEVMNALSHLHEWDDYFDVDHGSLIEEESEELQERFYNSAIYANYGFGEDGNPQPYPIIRDLAEDYGIGSITVNKHSHGPEVSPPADTRWSSGGQLLTQQDLGRIIAKCGDLVNAIDLRVSSDGDEEQTAEMILSRMSSRFEDFPLATGHSMSDPQSLYRLDYDGVVRKWFTVDACSRGLYSSLLQLLLPHMEVPVAMLMSLGHSSEVARERLLKWIPQYEDLFSDPQGGFGFSASECYSVFVDCENDNSGNAGWVLGKSLAQLRDLVAECKSEVQHFFNCSRTVREAAVENESAQNTTVLSIENEDGDEEQDEAPERTAPVDQGDANATVAENFLTYLLRWNEDDPDGLVECFPKQGMFSDYSSQQLSALLAVHDLRKKMVPLVDALLQQARDLQFPNIHELLQSAASKVPHLEQVHNATLGGSAEHKQCSILKNLNDATAKLTNASRIAYGELRLRGLKWDDASLTSRGIDGWAQQHRNLREAIRSGVTMLNNGAHVYPTLASLKSPVEALIKRMRTKYFADVVPPPSINGTLHLLRDRAKSGNDAAFLFMANTLQALWDLRCLIEHEPTRPYSRSHAAFLLNGLGVILEEGQEGVGD